MWRVTHPRWLTVAGLALDLLGVIAITAAVLVSRRGAHELARTVSGWNPAVERDRIRQTRFAIGGLIAIGTGFVLQLLGSWPR